MRWVRSAFRTVQLVLVLLDASLELLRERPRSRRDGAVWLHRLCRRAVDTFNLEMRSEGHFPDRGVLIANHVSYLDIILFAALKPCVFVSKAEIRGWPLLGWMTTMAGTVYVERGKGGSARKAGESMRAAAAEDLPVVFFPEGTTSDGTGLLKFHSGLLGEALGSGQPVTAAYLRYTIEGGKNPEARVTDDVAYWGDGSMVRHVIRFLGLRGVVANVRFGERPISFSEGRIGRKSAAVEARCAVLELKKTALGAETVRDEECDTVAGRAK